MANQQPQPKHYAKPLNRKQPQDSARSSQVSPSPKDGDVQQRKLVTLPQSAWDMLREMSYYIPKGDFSVKFYSRKLLHFSFVKEITAEARKLLFIYLMKEMFEFDTTICRGFSDVVYNEKDRQLLLNIAEKMEEIEEKGLPDNQSVEEEVGELAEEAA